MEQPIEECGDGGGVAEQLPPVVYPLARMHFRVASQVVFDQLLVAEGPHWTMSATGLAAF